MAPIRFMTIDYSDTSAERRAIDGKGLSLAWRRRARDWRQRANAWTAADFSAQAIWTPVFIGLGIGVYFGLSVEPSGLAAIAGVAAAALLICFAPRIRTVAIAVFLVAVGFLAAGFRTERIATPVLDRDIGIRGIDGRVHSIERSPDRERLVIDVISIDRLSTDATPKRIRVTWRGDRSNVAAGDLIALRAGLSPPPPPAFPGGFDFARQLYFRSIGAVGFAVTTPTRSGSEKQNSIRSRIENLRTGLTKRITEAAPGQGGAIVAAVVTGKREAISEQSRAALRDAGLAHLLAISGLHMGLATGLVFLAVRGGLNAIEPLAIRISVKKWAAAAALFSGFAYLLLSGAGWSPRRAFIMTAIFLIAILFDRRAFSLRNVAIAASLILLTTPEALVSPGFQMSFAAVTALIAVYEWWTRAANPGRAHTICARVKRYAIGLIVTDVVTSTATAPFALFHFNRVAIYSLPANFLAMPLMGFWIMPAAVVGLLLTPLGLDGPAWGIAAAGVDLLLKIGGAVSGAPGAVSQTSQWPVGALIAITVGGLWLCLARSPLRFLGVLGVPVAVLMFAGAPRPDVFVSAAGDNVGIVAENGQIVPYNNRRGKFAHRVWRESVGAATDDDELSEPMKFGACDANGCVAMVRRHAVAVVNRAEILAEDCARAEVVIALYPVDGGDWRACDAVLIDKRSAWRRGAHTVRFDGDDIIIKTVGATRHGRPWSGNSD